MAQTILKFLATALALASGILSLPHDAPPFNATSINVRRGDPKSDNPDDFFIDDEWHHLSCVYDGVSQHEYNQVERAFRDWIRTEDSMLSTESKVIFDYGYTRIWVCSFGGPQRAVEAEFDKFLRSANNKCHGDPGKGNNDRGAKLYYTEWKKEYGYGSTGYSPCPDVHHQTLKSLTPPNYNVNPWAPTVMSGGGQSQKPTK